MSKKQEIMVSVPANKVVIVTENHSGYMGGECIACGAMGWLHPRHGYPAHTKDTKPSSLQHEPDCPMNAALNNNGTLKKN